MSRRYFDRDYKQGIVQLLDSKQKSAKELSKQYGLNKFLIYKWRRALNGKSKKWLLPDINDPRDQEIDRLKIKLVDLILENEKLKAACSWELKKVAFSKQL